MWLEVIFIMHRAGSMVKLLLLIGYLLIHKSLFSETYVPAPQAIKGAAFRNFFVAKLNPLIPRANYWQLFKFWTKHLQTGRGASRAMRICHRLMHRRHLESRGEHSTPTEWLIHAPVADKGRYYTARKNVHFLCVIGREPFCGKK